MKFFAALAVATLALLLTACDSTGQERKPDAPYAVVVTKETQALTEWAAVVETLRKKHNAEVIVVPKLEECAEPLKQLQPRYVCYVGRPEEISTDGIRVIHRLSRKMDDDPFADFIWGIITGWSAASDARWASPGASSWAAQGPRR